MDGATQITFVEYSDWSCPRCHHDLSRLPSTAKFCPRCGQNQKDIPLADFVLPPVPEHVHSVMIVGYARAMTQLATRYEQCHNTDEALRCYCKAARLGNSEARSRLITRGASTASAAGGATSPDVPSDQPSPPVATAPQTT